MKKIFLLSLLAFTAFSLRTQAQCSGGTLAGNLTMTSAYQPQVDAPGGQNYYTFNAVSGANYFFSFCSADGGNSVDDTQITILDNTGAWAGGYNDDFCGLQSYLQWTAPSNGIYRVLISEFYCANSTVTNTFVYKEILPTPMVYVSSTTTQAVTTPVSRSSTNNQIIGVEVVTSGSTTPFAVTSLTLNSNGTTNFGTDVTNVNVWYTGNSATFTTTTLFGTAPNLSSPISGTQTLAAGTNYFWVTYDISATATLNDLVDAECTQIVMNGVGGTQVPTVTAPAGNRMIANCTPTYTYACSSGDFINNFSTTGGSTNITNNNTGCNGQPNNYIYYSTMGVTAGQGASFNVSMQSGPTYGQGFRIWIDWNQDGDYADVGEDVYNSGSASTSPFNGVVNVPVAAPLGNTTMRVRCSWASVPSTTDYCSLLSFGECEDYNVTVSLPSPMAYMSSTTTQNNTSNLMRGTTDNEIIGVQIVTAGALSPFDLTSLTLNSNGSTNFGTDVTNVKVWYTGTNSAFATTTLFGSAPNLSSPISGVQTLSPGANYFWLTYDISPTATLGDVVDAECTQIVMNGVGGTQVPSPTAPAGNRPIDYCTPQYTDSTDFGDYISLVLLGNINNPSGSYNGPGYTYYNPSTPTTTTNVTQGYNYSMGFQVGITDQEVISTWIDFDDNGTFDPAEEVVTDLLVPTANTTVNATVSIPLNAPVGVHRMRVRLVYYGSGFDACGLETWGECEDYNITVDPLPPIDMSVTALVSPTNTGCYTNSETVTVTIANLGGNLIDFSTNPVTVNAASTATNPMIFPPVVLTSGTLAPNATQNVVVSASYDMSVAGIYTFGAATSVSGDGNTSNDALAPVSVTSTVPSVVASGAASICMGDSTALTSTANAFGYSSTNNDTLTQSTDAGIFDYSTTVSNIVSSINVNANQLIAVIIDTLTHTFDGDMGISLIAPDNSYIDLSLYNGSFGDNYMGTIFSSTGPAISTGSAPFTGNFQPEQPFSGLTGSANGNWTMTIYDQAGGDQGTLSNWSLVFPGPNSIASYSWAPAAGLSSTTVANPMASPTVTTTYTITVTDDNGCSHSDTVTVTVNPAVIVNLGADQTQCGGSVLLDAGNPGSTYLWSTSATTQTITASATGTYIVTVTNISGCSSSDTVNVTINTIPVVNLGADITQCGGTSMLDAGNPGSTYLWSTTETTQQISISTSGTYTVMVTGTTGCTASDTILITINPLPLQSLGPDVQQCGGTIVLDAGNPGDNYLWSTTETTQQITVSTSGVYSVTVTTPQGCTVSDTIVVAIDSFPVADAGEDTSICIGSSITLDAGPGFATYLWQFGSFSATTQVITDTPGITTTYTLTVTNSAGCSATDVVVISVDVPPTPGFTFVVTNGNIVTFTNTSTGSAPMSFLWNFGDGSPTSTLANPVHTYTANGTYTVVLTATNACGTVSITMTVTVTGVGYEDLSMTGSINMYPNPTSGDLNLSAEMDLDQLFIEIYSLEGKMVYSSMDKNILSGFTKHIDLSDLANGMYSVRINTGNATKIGKLIIAK